MSEEVQSGGVDFHCHLDLYPDHEAVIARPKPRDSSLTVTTTPRRGLATTTHARHALRPRRAWYTSSTRC
jgi:TatD DNase family protein